MTRATGDVLLDTNVAIAILNGEAGPHKRMIGRTIYISSIVLGELYFGARKSARTVTNLHKIRTWVSPYPILNCDAGTADLFSMVKYELAAKGRPIPENDIWIAATARQHDLILVTRDEHFRQVEGLKIEMW